MSEQDSLAWPWRAGRSLGFTVYRMSGSRDDRKDDAYLGVMETPELAAHVVALQAGRASPGALASLASWAWVTGDPHGRSLYAMDGSRDGVLAGLMRTTEVAAQVAALHNAHLGGLSPEPAAAARAVAADARPAGAGVLVRCAAGGQAPRYLLQQRSAGVADHPGTWDLSGGGKLHPGEDPLDGALRELAEEMGPVPELWVTGSVTRVHAQGSPWRARRYTVFLAGCAQRFIPAPDPAVVAAARWCTADEAFRLPLRPAFGDELRHFAGPGA